MNSLPAWLYKKMPKHFYQKEIRSVLGDIQVNSICESAKCPNRGECFKKSIMTFLILGNNCTRSCSFCGVEKDESQILNPQEPKEIAEAVKKLKLRHVVITSVTRDDLADGGVEQFVKTCKMIKDQNPEVTLEILTPDFKGQEILWQQLLSLPIDVFNHNVETVPRLYPLIRPQAEYKRSLNMLNYFRINSFFQIKSGLMLGLGEEDAEVKKILNDLKEKGCQIVTIGQYIQPSKAQIEVRQYISLEKYQDYTEYGEKLGLKIFAGPWVRSSYQAEQVLVGMK